MPRPFVALAVAFVATPALAADPASAVALDGVFEFKAGPDVVARYHHGPKVAKPYLWPVTAPNGSVVTRPWPMVATTDPAATTDHVHQKSVWFCHGDVVPEGVPVPVQSVEKGAKGVDFWSETKDKDGKPRHGRIVCVRVGEPRATGDNGVAVETVNDWIMSDGVKILDETRTVEFRSLPAGRLFTFSIDLHAGVCPITFGDTKEGAFGIRIDDAIRLANKAGGVVTSSDGSTAKAPAKDNLPMWGQIADWNDYSGTVGGKAAGLAVFADPTNAVKSAWHTRAYGLMAANPFGRAGSGFPSQKGKTDLVRIEKGGHLKLRFGVYVHDGDATTGKVSEAFTAFKK